MCTHMHFNKPEQHTPNGNSGIMTDVHSFLRGFLNFPKVIHINIFITEKKQPNEPSANFVMLSVTSNVLNSIYEGKEK